MTRSRSLLAAALAVVTLLASGCGSSGPDMRQAAPTTWVTVHDEAGVRFSLPHQVEPETRPGGSPGVAARIYQDRLDEAGLSVSVVQAKVRFPANYARSTLTHMTALLEQGGADTVKMSRIKKVQVKKGHALDATLRFTATDGSTNYWRTRTITLGSTMVQAQVIQFSDGGADATAQADALFDELVANLELR